MRVIFAVLILFSLNLSCFSAKLTGEVSQQGVLEKNTVIEKNTGAGVDNAQISIPSKHFSTMTDSSGGFNIPQSMIPPYIMSVKKNGYKPFTLTVTDQSLSAPLILQIEKDDSSSLTIDSDMYHLGDNDYSANSANAGDFRVQSIGPFFNKQFRITAGKQNFCLRIGSIIGVDTKEAVRLAQSKVIFSYSSPVCIYINAKKIGEIKINGDNQRIPIPKNALKYNDMNEVRIATGINLFQHSYTDYDDIEFMNVSIEPR